MKMGTNITLSRIFPKSTFSWPFRSSNVVSETVAVSNYDACGALDTACNRTVAGVQWLLWYPSLLEAIGMLNLASKVTESEYFKFGNGGRLLSRKRYLCPLFCCCPDAHLGIGSRLREFRNAVWKGWS